VARDKGPHPLAVHVHCEEKSESSATTSLSLRETHWGRSAARERRQRRAGSRGEDRAAYGEDTNRRRARENTHRIGDAHRQDPVDTELREAVQHEVLRQVKDLEKTRTRRSAAVIFQLSPWVTLTYGNCLGGDRSVNVDKVCDDGS
jgi:hypothetical protein